MLDHIEEDTVRYLFLIQPVVEVERPQRREQPMYYQRPQESAGGVRVKQARPLIPGKKKRH